MFGFSWDVKALKTPLIMLMFVHFRKNVGVFTHPYILNSIFLQCLCVDFNWLAGVSYFLISLQCKSEVCTINSDWRTRKLLIYVLLVCLQHISYMTIDLRLHTFKTHVMFTQHVYNLMYYPLALCVVIISKHNNTLKLSIRVVIPGNLPWRLVAGINPYMVPTFTFVFFLSGFWPCVIYCM